MTHCPKCDKDKKGAIYRYKGQWICEDCYEEILENEQIHIKSAGRERKKG